MVYREQMSSEILDFLREVDENWALLVHYAACSGNSLLTFRDNLSVPSSRVKIQGHYTLLNSPEECSSQMSSVSVSWFGHLHGTDTHTRTLFFLFCEGNCLLGTLGENSDRTPYNTLHVAYTILFLLTMWRELSRINYLLLETGWAINTWRAVCFCRLLFLSNRCKLVAWFPTAVPQDASRADFMCKRWRRVLAWLFFLRPFSVSLSLSLYRNSRYMVEWGITTFAENIFEETVASSFRKFCIRNC